MMDLGDCSVTAFVCLAVGQREDDVARDFQRLPNYSS